MDPEAYRAASALLWDGRGGPRRGPRPTLSLATIARAGVALADADGLPAVTMQAVAEALGVTKMALYRYVPGKAELVALMVETGMGDPPPLDTGAGWRGRLDGWARELCARFLAHPWSLAATVGVRPMGPNELAWLESAVAALDGTGLHGGERLDVVVTLTGHVRSLAEQVVAVGTGTPEAGMADALGALLAGRADRFPALAAALASAAAHAAHDQALDVGLGLILDGVDLLVTRRRAADGRRAN
ncbi:TetR/AcrR family transcriptional regulator [Micromonospora zhanjiangensis]|uniref:TetR/AcrR family transcriptional regulator n=1 Tax=Micromonospora zhanjiangensis TaxID=1522057 RepID=A0ABV8KT97_9ACTN